MRKRFTDEQRVKVLKEHAAGRNVKDLIREHQISEQTFYKWKSKYGGLELSDVKRLKSLEKENSHLKKLLAERDLEVDALKDVLTKKF
jgi:putative transposase